MLLLTVTEKELPENFEVLETEPVGLENDSESEFQPPLKRKSYGCHKQANFILGGP